jgi:hypothetical protein
MTDPEGIRRLLTRDFSFEGMQRGYVDAITGELPDAPPSEPARDDRFTLAPWCSVSGNDVYNDYDFAWTRSAEVAPFLEPLEEQVFSRDMAIEAGLSADQIETALKDGLIVKA